MRGPTFAPLWKVSLPMLIWQMMPSNARRGRAFAELFTTPDETWSAFMGDAMRMVRMDFSLPPLATPA